MTARESCIDLLKTAAMFMVVYYHCCYYYLDFGYKAGSADYLPNTARALMNLCSMGVPLFFMCSGYCTLASPASTWRKMGRKALTILLLTLIWSMLIPFPAWFFITLAALYLATPVLRLIRQQHPRLYWSAMACLFLGCFGLNEFCALSHLLSPNVPAGASIRGFFTAYALVYYALGEYLRGRKLPVWTGIASFVSGFALSLLDGTLLTRAQGVMFDGVNAAFPMLSALLMSLGLFSLSQHLILKPESAPARALATLSGGCLAVYLLHLFLHLKAAEQLLSGMDTMSLPLSTGWALSICTLSWAAGMLIRRIPGIRCLMKL